MSEPTIELRDLRKRFKVSDSGVASLKTALLWWKRGSRFREFDALRGVDLEVHPGEVVAVVGRNGAGKSTLLSLIARVYKPTSGTVTAKGRIAPLLELGAGFHPDLSGLENIEFNAMILGLTRAEARARTEEIVEFAEIRDAIGSPVRTYSSGMMARLGFSIAVHVDADALIVDEVLAVGDHAFERKCYDRIERFHAAGGAVLFVSHDMDSVRRVADRVVWLERGAIRAQGDPETVIRDYLADETDLRPERTAPEPISPPQTEDA